MKNLWWLLLVPVAALFWWAYARRSAPPEVPFIKVGLETIVETVVTNGKVEPVEWAAVRAGREGVITQLRAEKGRAVAEGEVLAELDSSEARIALASAEARVTQAQAELEVLDRGGKAQELAEIDGSISRARVDLEAASKESGSLRRLVEKNAATKHEMLQAVIRVKAAAAQIRALETKRSSLASPPDRSAAAARLRDAQTTVEAARQRLELTLVHSPAAGVVYHVEPRVGAYLRPGDLVANVGRLDRVRVSVYVDEPDLGRVTTGVPVTITWDALPGRKWEGTVEKGAANVFALGTRQVGEVICSIANPGRALAPGANVNVSVRTRVAENVLALPKECLRREGDSSGVYILAGNKLAWRAVRTGISSVTRTEVLQGLKSGELVALPSEHQLTAGMEVRALVR
jgi:multidrug efflux pump subunit AcrA (membrane-fusion protein)